MIAAFVAFAAPPASAQWIVYDPTNFSQNVLTAARELQQINNQIRTYIAEVLAPALRPGDTAVMDDLPPSACHSTQLRCAEPLAGSAHNVAGVQQAIEAAGAHLLYLPAYSPDFNPIEMAFAKLKALLRTAAARTIPDLWTAIRQAFTRFKPHECRNYLVAAGYDAYDPA